LWLHSLKVAQLLRSAACLHTNQSRSYLNHLVIFLSVANLKQVRKKTVFIQHTKQLRGVCRCASSVSCHSHNPYLQSIPAAAKYGPLNLLSSAQASFTSIRQFLLATNLMHFFMYLFIHFISLHVSSIN